MNYGVLCSPNKNNKFCVIKLCTSFFFLEKNFVAVFCFGDFALVYFPGEMYLVQLVLYVFKIHLIFLILKLIFQKYFIYYVHYRL